MTTIPISPDIWQLAQQVCTERQLLILTLREKHGFSWNQLAVNLNCTRANVREIHRAATKNLLDELERQRTETQNGATPTTTETRPVSGGTARVSASGRAHHHHPRQT